MIEQTQLFIAEYNDRPPKSSAEVPTYRHAISFPELKSLALTCKEALERSLPEHPDLVENWYVPNDEDSAGPTEVLTDLTKKRTTLRQALNLLGVRLKDLEPPQSWWRNLLGHIDFVPRWITAIGAIGTGVVIIGGIVHWVLGLF